MDIIFMGTPEFAVESLKALHERKHTIKAVVTAPDRQAGRGRKLQQSAVKTYADQHELPLLQPTNLKDEAFIKELETLKPDLIVVVAFRMLPKVVWDLPEKGTINLHASLLPNYRGAAPINWAVINGEQKTGASTFFINERIDTGAILEQVEVAIKDTDSAGDIHDLLMIEGAKLLVHTADALEEGSIKPQIQQLHGNEKEAPKLFKEDMRLDMDSEADTIYNKIRGLSPFPGAYAMLQHEDKELQFKIISASRTDVKPTQATGTLVQNGHHELLLHAKGGVLRLNEVQLQGKRRMKTVDFLNGMKLNSTDKLV
jgi:methionyl-tRNA formyltransferase